LDDGGFNRIYPDGAADIVVSAENASAHGPAPSFRWISSKVPLAGLRIRRGSAKAVLGVSPSELAAGPVSIGDLWGQRGRDVAERLADSFASAVPIASMASLLAELLAGTGEPDGAVLGAIDGLVFPRGTPMGALVRDIGLSERQLRRRFKNHVGLGMREYARIMRFQRLLDTIRLRQRDRGASPAGWAALASDHGYADQAHLIREVRALPD